MDTTIYIKYVCSKGYVHVHTYSEKGWLENLLLQSFSKVNKKIQSDSNNLVSYTYVRTSFDQLWEKVAVCTCLVAFREILFYLHY